MFAVSIKEMKTSFTTTGMINDRKAWRTRKEGTM